VDDWPRGFVSIWHAGAQRGRKHAILLPSILSSSWPEPLGWPVCGPLARCIVSWVRSLLILGDLTAPDLMLDRMEELGPYLTDVLRRDGIGTDCLA